MSTCSRVQRLAMELIRRPSVTPDDHGCQELLASLLQSAGCSVERLPRGATSNLLTLHGRGDPFLLFLGHTDVVPPGSEEEWAHPPFLGQPLEYSGRTVLWGRGSADMKGADAAMAVAMADFALSCPAHGGTVGMLITSNEEGDGSGGIREIAPLLRERGLIPAWCIVGEPSSTDRLGDGIKVGRRGSLTAHVCISGIQGHVAYPQQVSNPIHAAAALISRLCVPLDCGTRYFPPTSFQVTDVHAGNGIENQVPGSCAFMCNWRFNDLQSRESIERCVAGITADLGVQCQVRYVLNGEPFLSEDPRLIAVITEAIRSELGLTPELSTSGGTSDGRFIAPLGTQTIELGLVSRTIHKVDECIDFEDLNRLTAVYGRILRGLLPV